MKISYDCYPCFMRLLVESSELAGASEPAREAALRELLEHLLATPRDTPPPLMGMAIQRIVKRAAQNPDPYKELKERFNRAALELYPVLKQRIRQSPRPLETAARLAIAGNIIDNGYSPNLTREAVESALAECLAAEPSVNDFPLLEKEIARAKSILYLADNAGEIVFDRLFIEEFPKGKTTVVVRGAPILNDVLLEDARAVGLDSVAEIISNGHDAPGTWLPDCPKEFRERFAAADLVIAKGQGNYETLSETPRPNLFFLLKAKCPVVAREFGAAPGALIIRQCSASR